MNLSMHSRETPDVSRVLCKKCAASFSDIAFARDPQAWHLGSHGGPAGALGGLAVASEFGQAELGSLYKAAWCGTSGACTCPMESKTRTTCCTSAGTAPKSQECRNWCCTTSCLYMREESVCEKCTSVATSPGDGCACVGTSVGLALESLYGVSCGAASGARACARRNVLPSIRGLCFRRLGNWRRYHGDLFSSYFGAFFSERRQACIDPLGFFQMVSHALFVRQEFRWYLREIFAGTATY